MAIMGLVSLMLFHEQFVASPSLAPPAVATRVVVGDTVTLDGHSERAR